MLGLHDPFPSWLFNWGTSTLPLVVHLGPGREVLPELGHLREQRVDQLLQGVHQPVGRRLSTTVVEAVDGACEGGWGRRAGRAAAALNTLQELPCEGKAEEALQAVRASALTLFACQFREQVEGQALRVHGGERRARAGGPCAGVRDLARGDAAE